MKKEVYFIKDDVINVDASMLHDMKQKAAQNLSGKVRYCFHESEEAAVQEMLFVIPDFGYTRPHMHKDAAESHVILDGEGYCVLFDDLGNIVESFRISPKSNFMYRIQKGIWHMVLPLSNQMVIYEVREGKFDNSTNTFPKWAPHENEKGMVRQYKNNLMKQIQRG